MAQKMSSGYIDAHCHLLPFLDDGPENIDESLRMAEVLTSFGFSDICCTPHHLTGVYDNYPDKVEKTVSDFRKELVNSDFEVQLHPGLEYYLDESLAACIVNPLILPGGYFLIEAPVQVSPDFLADGIYQIIRKGYKPLLAHPERCATVTAHPGLLGRLMEMGCLLQGNIGSFAGVYGERVRAQAGRLLERGLLTCLGTDAHSSEGLEKMLEKGSEEIERAAGQGTLQKLLCWNSFSICTRTSKCGS